MSRMWETGESRTDTCKVGRPEKGESSRIIMLSRSLVAVLVLLVAPALAPAQDKVTVKVLNGERVYSPRGLVSGTTTEVMKPALCDCRRVLDATPEYNKIRDERIKKDTAEHRLLVQAASNRLKSALQRVMSQKGYDLVAETGAIVVEGKELPDVTDEIIQSL